MNSFNQLLIAHIVIRKQLQLSRAAQLLLQFPNKKLIYLV